MRLCIRGRRFGRSAWWSIAAIAATTSGAQAPAVAQANLRQTAHASAAAISSVLPTSTPVRLSYLYKAGDVRRFKVTGIFNGRFPPFSSPGSAPVHLMIQIDYISTVKQVNDKGAQVAFEVEAADLSILEDDPGPTGKIDPDKAAPFPIPLSSVQKMFNATATFKPNGEIADIQGGDNSSIRIDLGIDQRKLFLVTAPIILAKTAVKAGDTWPFSDGLLGNKEGRTSYTGKLERAETNGKQFSALVSQEATSTVDSKLDKEGNSTSDAAAAVGSLAGTVKLTGRMQMVGATNGATEAPLTVKEALLNMVVDMKRTLPDPEMPGKQQVTDIDIKARLTVEPKKPATKPSVKAKPSSKGRTGSRKAGRG